MGSELSPKAPATSTARVLSTVVHCAWQGRTTGAVNQYCQSALYSGPLCLAGKTFHIILPRLYRNVFLSLTPGGRLCHSFPQVELLRAPNQNMIQAYKSRVKSLKNYLRLETIRQSF